MKILCPICKQNVPSDQVNMAADLAYCPECEEGFAISENIDEEVKIDVVNSPPKGAWYKDNMDHCIIGISTRSWIAIFWVPFLCGWTGILVVALYESKLFEKEFDPVILVFGIPFLFVAILLWSYALMAVFGKIEVTIGKESSVFIGVGFIGRTRTFDWSGVVSIKETRTRFLYNGQYRFPIFLEGKKRVKLCECLNDERRYFLLNALKYVKSRKRF